MVKEEMPKGQFEVTGKLHALDVWLNSVQRIPLGKAQTSEPLFRLEETGELKAATWMLCLVIGFKRENFGKLIQPAAMKEALETGECRGKPGVSIVNKAGEFTFKNGADFVHFEKIVFDLELTVRRKKSG
jgi:hypothetical protein